MFTASSQSQQLSPPPLPRRVFHNAMRLLPDGVLRTGATKNSLRQPCQIAFSTEGENILHIHVPDAAAYIPQGSPLEATARHRQRSIYTPETSITMLPVHVEASLCFPLYATSPIMTITYTGRVAADGTITDWSVALTACDDVTHMTYSQVDVARGPHPTWRTVRELTARSLLRRASHGASLISFDDLSCIEVMPQGPHCLTHDMVLADPQCVDAVFGMCPVRAAMAKALVCTAHYVIRELEVIAGEIHFLATTKQHLATSSPAETTFSLFSSAPDNVTLDNAQDQDVFTTICEALRSPDTHAPFLRSIYHRRGLGTRTLPCTNPLGSFAELTAQYAVHGLEVKEDHTDAARAAFFEGRVSELLKNRRAMFIRRWVAQQPSAGPTTTVKRMRCVVVQRAFNHTVFLAPMLGHVFEAPGGAAVWGRDDVAMVPLPVMWAMPLETCAA